MKRCNVAHLRADIRRMDFQKFESERLQTVQNPIQRGRVEADDPQTRVPALDCDIDIVECIPKLATHLTHDGDVENLLAHRFSSNDSGSVSRRSHIVPQYSSRTSG